MIVQGIDLKHLSYSSITLWERCPREWILKYKYNITSPIGDAFPFGTAAHKVVQHGLLNGGITAETAENFGVSLRRELVKSKLRITPTSFANLEQVGMAMFANETTQYILNSIKVSDPYNIERKISFWVPDVPIPIIGYIDIIDDDGQLYDIKTSRWGWSDEDAKKELQPDFYLTAMDAMEDTRHHGLFNHIIMVKDANAPVSYLLTTERGQEYTERVYSAVQTMWTELLSGELSKPGGSLCAQCKLQARCEAL